VLKRCAVRIRLKQLFHDMVNVFTIVTQRARNGCGGRIADMTVPEVLRVDTDGGIKPDMAFLALLCE